MKTPGYVYILLCSDQTYYTGVTTDPEVRIAEHHSGLKNGYTKSRRPLKLVFIDTFPDIEQAIFAEKRIKGWSRKKKEALIASDFEALIAYSSTGIT